MIKTSANLTFAGRTLVPGLGHGPTFVYRNDLNRLDEFYEIRALDVGDELERFDEALGRISGELRDLAREVKKEMDAGLADIFEAHSVMLEDASLRAEVATEICDELVSAGSAANRVFQRWEQRFRSMEAKAAGQNADDMQDLARRVLFALAGIRAHDLEDLPPGSVLVANRLLPTDTIFLGRRSAAAAVLEVAGPASHAALFAHELGLPCIAGISGVVDRTPPGGLALVDADAGAVTIEPDEERKRGFFAKRRSQERAASTARAQAQRKAKAKSGETISVFANIGRVEDTHEAIRNGADGIGLYRVETFYMGRRDPPALSVLLEEMHKTLEPAKALPICVRLLDIGADKPLPFMEQQREPNPALGRRGIRLLLQYPELLVTQIRALLELSQHFDLHILVPMVTLAEDMKAARDCLVETSHRAGIARVPALGAMIETPAAALSAPEIAKYSDFVSFGTNDLTQYTFAADRENEAVAAYFADTHAALFRLLRIVREDLPETSLCVCGELASRPEATAELIRCGITSLSVAPVSIPAIKAAVRRVDA